MLRHDHSGYFWLFEFPNIVAKNAATAIIKFSAPSRVPEALMPNGPTKFRNKNVRVVAKGLSLLLHLTLSYFPRSNGAIERLGRELLCMARLVLYELRPRFKEWPDILSLIQSALNNYPLTQRGNQTPITCFHGSDPT